MVLRQQNIVKLCKNEGLSYNDNGLHGTEVSDDSGF